MKNTAFIKFITTSDSPVEDNLISVKTEYLFDGKKFRWDDTIEEAKDRFYSEINPDNDQRLFDTIEVYSYKNRKALDKGVQDEFLQVLNP